MFRICKLIGGRVISLRSKRVLLISKKPAVSRILASRMARDCFKRELPDFYVQVIPALSDNFMYLVVDNATKESAVVDPVNPGKVWQTNPLRPYSLHVRFQALEVVEREGTQLTTVLTTHHHWYASLITDASLFIMPTTHLHKGPCGW